MVKVMDIPINISTVDGCEKATINFSPISDIKAKDSISLCTTNGTVDLICESDVSTSLWIDWIVANFNILPSINASASRDGDKTLVIQANNSDSLNIVLDLGEG